MLNRIDPIQLGGRLRRLRQERAWSVLALATGAGLSSRYVTEVEAGRANPTLKALDQLAQAFDLRLVDLLPKPHSVGPKAAIERVLDRRSFEELEGIARTLELRFERRQRRVVALLGVRGSGKSLIGAELAARLGLKFVELDTLVEQRSGLPLGELFSLHGESYYRQIEEVCLSEVLSADEPMVLATGGGIVEHLESYDLLLRCAVTVWLSAHPETLWARVVAQGDARPMAGRATALAQLRLLLTRRASLYAKAQLKVDTNDALPHRLVADLVEDLQLLRADKGQLKQTE